MKKLQPEPIMLRPLDDICTIVASKKMFRLDPLYLHVSPALRERLERVHPGVNMFFRMEIVVNTELLGESFALRSEGL